MLLVRVVQRADQGHLLVPRVARAVTGPTMPSTVTPMAAWSWRTDVPGPALTPKSNTIKAMLIGRRSQRMACQ